MLRRLANLLICRRPRIGIPLKSPGRVEVYAAYGRIDTKDRGQVGLRDRDVVEACQAEGLDVDVLR